MLKRFKKATNPLLVKIKEDADEYDHGTILWKTKDGVAYYCEAIDESHFYRYEEAFSKKTIPELTYIGCKVSRLGITKEMITDLLETVYGDSLPRMTQTLTSIALYSNRKEFETAVRFSDEREAGNADMQEWVWYSDFRNKETSDLYGYGTILINVNYLERHTKDRQELLDRIKEVLIRETRILSNATNLFLEEEEYLSSEEELNQFVAEAMEKVETKCQPMGKIIPICSYKQEEEELTL